MAVLKALWAAALTASTLVSAQAKVHITQQTYDTMSRYTAYQAASANVPCAIPPFNSTVVSYVDNTITDTQATIFRDDTSKELIVAIPGTASNEDKFFDILIVLVPLLTPGVDLASCPLCTVHKGFLTVWNSIAPEIISTLQSELQSHAGYSVTISGHSLGAGIAAIGYASLLGSKLPVTQAYTFGQPRTGNAAFANHIDTLAGASNTSPGNFWRLTHADDIIPRLIPRLPLLYQHSRTEFWQTNGTDGRTGAELTYRCFGQEPADCNNSEGLAFTAQSHVIYTNEDLSSDYSCIGNI